MTDLREVVMPYRVWAAVIVMTLAFVPAGSCGDITPEGKKLAESLDAMDVEHLWIPKHRVAWKTGKSLGPELMDGRSHTHCSAFVAAVCLRHDVYILRPPEHTTTLLANAQADWLAGEGEKKGWKSVKTATAAQQQANQGKLVVVVFKEANPEKSGHIAIVRPSTKSDADIRESGPEVIQAGKTNANSTSAREGFKNHKAAWPDGLRYYVHELKGD
ncbi:hypothetical protein FRUB_10487 [Fimbriiglobus ruber]|uniref:Uncharacterized protein n=2 Tax=Fimbriiglobus ruber TaxID=1908690 RepID=A0A225DB40_9BACT|nr:hypothetical protein FRUB_10487 [Fimbriiglobus ruber]